MDKASDVAKTCRKDMIKVFEEWERIIISILKKDEEFDLEMDREEFNIEMAAEVAPEKFSHVLKNLSDHAEEVVRNPEDYPEVIYLLSLHVYVIKGERFSEFPLEEQKCVLENAAFASSEAASISRRLGEKELGARYRGVAGNAFYRLNELFEAEKEYKKALEMYEDLEGENSEEYRFRVVKTLNNLGTFYTNTGKLFQGEIMYIKALEIMECLVKENPHRYSPYMAIILNGLGDFYKNAGKFSEAEEALSRALEIRRNLAEENPEMHQPAVASTLNSLGLLHFDTALPKAKKEYDEALNKVKEKYDEASKKMQNYYDEALKKAKEKCDEASKKIEKEYEEALNIYKCLAKENPNTYLSNVAGCWNNIGNLHIETEKFCQAEDAYNKALEKYKILEKQNPATYTPDVATSLNNLGVLYKNTKRFPQAKKAFNKAKRKYEEAALWFDAARTYYNLSTIESDTEILENSRRLLELAILFSREEEYRYAQKGAKESIYLSLLEKDMSTFGVLEALRDPQLLSLPWEKAEQHVSHDVDTDHILSKEELERAQNDIDFQKHLVEEAMLKKNVPYCKPIALPENLIFIYIQIIQDSVWFFAIVNSETKRSECQKEFIKKGIELDYCLKVQEKIRGGAQTFETLARQWYETLPQEIKEFIQEKEYVVFSPDYYCSSLPLEALQRDDQPLCIEKTVVRATSLNQFSALLKKKPRFDSSLIVGNPWPRIHPSVRLFSKKMLEYTLPANPEKHYTISYLENAEKEAREIYKCLADCKFPNLKTLLGKDATGEEFLSEIKKHSLVHFSGHGRLGRILFLSGPFKRFPPPYEPKEFSDLRKAERTGIIGKINMMEEWHPVTDLDLLKVPFQESGAIVFLNACETGLHRYGRGGYYQGLSAAFLKNGAHSVISSLIPLFDESSKKFATEFYERLKETRSVSQSLKEARISMKEARISMKKEKKYKLQIYWIPYIHYGSPF